MTSTDVPALSYSSVPGRWVLAITVLGSGIAALDATVVNIALPVIGRDFHTGIAALQWVMTSYILTLAAGFRIAVLISGGLCAAGGLLAAVTITNPPREPPPAGSPGPCLHCALEAPPLTIAPAGYAEASTTVRSG